MLFPGQQSSPLLQLYTPTPQSIPKNMIPGRIYSTDIRYPSILIRSRSTQSPYVKATPESSNRRCGRSIYLLSTDIGDSLKCFQPTPVLSEPELWLLQGRLKYWFPPFLVPLTRSLEALLNCIFERLFVYLFTFFHGHVDRAPY